MCQATVRSAATLARDRKEEQDIKRRAALRIARSSRELSITLDLSSFSQLLDDFKAFTFKHQATPLTAFCGTLIVLGGLSLMQAAARYAGASDAMLAIGSFAAVCTLLFAAPAAPLGVPWNMLVGHAVSVGVALVVHWTSAPLEQLFGISMHEVRKVLVPSLAIALQMKVGAVNPPAAAAAEIFASDPLAQRQPLYGAFFLVAPALVGTAWALLVQYATMRTVKLLKARRDGTGPPPATAPEPTVKVSVVDPAEAVVIVQAIEGAAYVEEPLTYLIDTLTADRRRMELTRSVLSKIKFLNPRHRGASQIQRLFRKHKALKAMTEPTQIMV